MEKLKWADVKPGDLIFYYKKFAWPESKDHFAVLVLHIADHSARQKIIYSFFNGRLNDFTVNKIDDINFEDHGIYHL